jgi:hypothetical protein
VQEQRFGGAFADRRVSGGKFDAIGQLLSVATLDAPALSRRSLLVQEIEWDNIDGFMGVRNTEIGAKGEAPRPT